MDRPIALDLDISAVQHPFNGERGIPVWVREFAFALDRAHDPAELDPMLLLDDDFAVPPSLTELLAGGRLARRRHADRRRRPDLLHIGDGFYPLRGGVPQDAIAAGTRLAYTLYDLIPFLHPDRHLSDPRFRAQYQSRLEWVRHADLLLAISDSARDDAVEHLGLHPDRVVTVGTGVPSRFVPAADREEAFERAARAVPGLRPGFVMYTGGDDPRKNLDGLMAAYALLPVSLRTAHQLVLVFKVGQRRLAELQREAASLGILRDVLFTGFVPDETLIALYQSTGLFVFPSHYEGFGLPVAEAQSCGAIAVGGDNSSLRELLPDPESRFDTEDPEAIADAIRRGLEDETLRARAQAHATTVDYSWRAVAERAIGAYRRLGTRPVPSFRPRRERPRIAFVTPMPPVPSSVADYSRLMLDELRRLVDVDVFTDPEADRLPWDGVDWHAYSAFETIRMDRGGFDDVLYAFGNSDHYTGVMRTLQRVRGGTALVHDAWLLGTFLPGVFDHRFPVTDRQREVVASTRSGIKPVPEGHYANWQVHEYLALNDLLSGDVLQLADRVLVHSRTAATMIELERGLRSEDLDRISVIPFGHRDASGRPPVPDDERDVVVSFGIASSSKQSGKVVDAFIELATRHPALRFALVGPTEWWEPRDRERAFERVRAAGLEERILFTGRVSDEGFDDWLDRAVLAVQLRDTSHGETSGAVAHCFAWGVPVVATDLGSLRELPEGSVAFVPREIGPAALADRVDALLSDEPALAALRERMREHVASHRFADTARAAVAHLLG